MRLKVVCAKQHPESVQRGLGPEARAFDRVNRVEETPDAENLEHFLDVVARRVGKDELAAAQLRERVAQRALAHYHPAELGKLVRLAQEPPRVGPVVTHQALQR